MNNSDFETSQVGDWDAFTWLMRILIYVPPSWQNTCKEVMSVTHAKRVSFQLENSVCMNLYFSDAASQLIPCAALGRLLKL